MRAVSPLRASNTGAIYGLSVGMLTHKDSKRPLEPLEAAETSFRAQATELYDVIGRMVSDDAERVPQPNSGSTVSKEPPEVQKTENWMDGGIVPIAGWRVWRPEGFRMAKGPLAVA
jgi:hypothetical protein